MEFQNLEPFTLYPSLCRRETEASAPPHFGGVWEGDFFYRNYSKTLREKQNKVEYNIKMGMPPPQRTLFACLYLFSFLLLASLLGCASTLFPV